ncbi:heparinase II/III family protein [Vagococcus fessus]|nr:heparinase II/III family protein [Vagococcus fessus]
MKQAEFIKMIHKNNFAKTAEAIENADHLLENNFVFTHPYDMEPYHKIINMKKIDWLYTPNEDEEWIFMLNRQEYLIDLLTAYYVTDKDKYLLKAKDLMLEWLVNCAEPGGLAWRTIDTGIRVLYWSVLYTELKQSEFLKPEEKKQLDDGLKMQVNYLDEHYITKYDLSNWGVLISSGIVVLANQHPELVSIESYERNEARLVKQCQLQVQNSGLHWEQSPLYFMEVWRQLSLVMLSYKEVLNECPTVITETVNRMLEVAPYFVKPNGYILQQGDTDLIKIDDMIQTFSLILDKELPTRHIERVCLDLLVLTFDSVKTKFKVLDIQKRLGELQTSKKQKQCIDYETGNFFYHKDWEADSSFLHIFNGVISSGHGHASLGHFDYMVSGEDVMIDPGRYTYCETPERLLLKEAKSHNVLVINEEPFTEIKDSWAFKKSTTPLSSVSSTYNDVTTTQISYLEEQSTGNKLVTRTFIWFQKEELLIVTDHIKASGHNKVEQFLNLGETITPEISEKIVVFRGDKTTLYTHQNYQQISKEESLWSPTYNKMSETTRLKMSSEFDGSFFGYTVYSLNNQTAATLAKVEQSANAGGVSIDKCVGIKVTIGDNEKIISLQHQDTFSGHKLYYVENEAVYGKVTLVNIENGVRDYQRLL